MRKASFNKIELAVCNFNCEPLHDHGGNYAENFNIRNIAANMDVWQNMTLQKFR